MPPAIRHFCAVFFMVFTVASCSSGNANDENSEATTTTGVSTAPTTQPERETVGTTEESDIENEGLATSGFEQLSAFITETATFVGPTGQATTLVAELPDQTLPLELTLFIGEWTESYQQSSGGEVFLNTETAYSLGITYTCAQTNGWLAHIEGSTFQWSGGFAPTGDESGEDCDVETYDLAFVEDLLANADNLQLDVVDNTLLLRFEGYETTWLSIRGER